jgi:hypothetical protein
MRVSPIKTHHPIRDDAPTLREERRTRTFPEGIRRFSMLQCPQVIAERLAVMAHDKAR